MEGVWRIPSDFKQNLGKTESRIKGVRSLHNSVSHGGRNGQVGDVNMKAREFEKLLTGGRKLIVRGVTGRNLP